MEHSVENEKRMRLFVAGEAWDDPDKWNAELHMFVIAPTEEEAAKMVDFTSTLVEIKMDRPLVFR